MCKYLFILFLVFSMSQSSSVDILSTDGMVFVAWSEGGMSHLILSDSSAVRSFASPELTIGEMHVNQDLYIACSPSNWNSNSPDSLYLLDPYSLSTESAYEIDYQDFLSGSYEPHEVHMSTRVARHSMNDTPVYISTKYTGYDYQTGELGAGMARFVPDTTNMDLTLSEARTAIFSFTYCSITSLSSPVSCSQPNPMSFWHHYFSWHGVNNILCSGVYEMPPDESLILDTSVFYSGDCYYMEDMPELKAYGSCSSEIVTLWTSTFMDSMCCTLFDASGPTATDSYMFPFDMPPVESPWAMSCNPEDMGILFVWYEDGSIISRHYLNNWNSDTYLVQSGLADIEEDNLSVCSDQDGYWVAWMESVRSEPEFLFVPRDSVSTSIEGGAPPSATELIISPVVNPVHGPLRFNVEGGTGGYDVLIYDMSGRLKLDDKFYDKGAITLSDELPSGTYVVRVIDEFESASCKVIVL